MFVYIFLFLFWPIIFCTCNYMSYRTGCISPYRHAVLKHVMNLVFLISMLLSDKYYYTPKWLCNGRNYINITSIKTPQVGLFSKLSVCFNHFTIVSLVEDISLHLKKKWILITQGYYMPSCTFTISQFFPFKKNCA